MKELVYTKGQMLNNDTVSLFECLCSDLGMKLIAKCDQKSLGDLRNELLGLAESGFDSSLMDVWVRNFDRVFIYKHTKSIANPAVFRDVYQVLSFLLKVKLPSTREQESEYYSRFKATEDATRRYRVDPARESTRLAKYICRRTLASLDISPSSLEGSCRHGPGSTYEGEVGTDKNWFRCFPQRQLGKLGYSHYYANAEFLYESLSRNLYDRSGDFIVSRLSLVPKDYKGPRGVFISPKEAVFTQLGQWRVMRAYFQRTWLRNVYTWNSQVPSQELALSSSYDRGWATLDLSDASDRIPLSLMAHLLARPDYLALARSRPCYVETPQGRSRLSMFAPMGDGKTFPVLTMVVSFLAITAILLQDGWIAARPPPMEVVEQASKKLRVYGDDIIVRSEYYTSVVEVLQTHNLKVNVGKSFVRGRFRESCGLDAFDGVVVTPLRLRCLVAKHNQLKLVDLHNRIMLSRSELRRTAAYLREYVTRKHMKPVGYTSRPDLCPTCLYVHKDEVNYLALRYCKTRYNTELHRVDQKCQVAPGAIKYPTCSDGWYDLNYWLLTANHSDEESEVTFADPLDPSGISPIGSADEADILTDISQRYRLGYRLPRKRSSCVSWVPIV